MEFVGGVLGLVLFVDLSAAVPVDVVDFLEASLVSDCLVLPVPDMDFASSILAPVPPYLEDDCVAVDCPFESFAGSYFFWMLASAFFWSRVSAIVFPFVCVGAGGSFFWVDFEVSVFAYIDIFSINYL